jgi:hypothetical protein
MPAKAKTDDKSSLQLEKMTVTVSEDEDGSPEFSRPVVERPFMYCRLRMLVAARYAKSMGEVVDCTVNL